MDYDKQSGDTQGKIVQDHKKIGKQIHLPFSKAVAISYKNVRVRLGRSIVTSLGITLGIAFLVSVVSARYFDIAAQTLQSKEIQLKITATDTWLISLSLLVSILGITNSLLMSVTERFREIGTMKCLGALDIFIVKLYLIECIFLGVLGSFTGVILGFLFSAVQYLLSDGFAVFPATDMGSLMLWLGGSFLAGVILSGLGGIYPSYIATKLKPADAMRSVI